MAQNGLIISLISYYLHILHAKKADRRNIKERQNKNESLLNSCPLKGQMKQQKQQSSRLIITLAQNEIGEQRTTFDI